MKLSVLPQVARTHMRPARAQTYFVHRNLDRLTEDPNAHPGQLCTLQGNFRGISLALLKARHHITVPPVQQPRGNSLRAIHHSTRRAEHCCSQGMPCELEVVSLTPLVTYDNRAHSCVWDKP
jgi:hypothetical protein